MLKGIFYIYAYFHFSRMNSYDMMAAPKNIENVLNFWVFCEYVCTSLLAHTQQD